jgi:hypothetical protein
MPIQEHIEAAAAEKWNEIAERQGSPTPDAAALIFSSSLAVSAKRQADALEKLVEIRLKDREPVLEMAREGPSLEERQIDVLERIAEHLRTLAGELAHPEYGIAPTRRAGAH